MNNVFTRYLTPGSLLIAVALTGCSSSRSVSMNSMNPAELTFPSEIQTLLIVDRTEFHDGTVGLLEAVVTGELLDQDRAGLQAMISSLRNQLTWSGRFDTRVAGYSLPGNSLTGTFPDPLEWDEVKDLTDRYGGDVVLAIEIFDSDFIVTDGKRRVTKSIKVEGGENETEVTEYYAEGIANMTIGFRIYDPASRNVLDEDVFNRTHTWEAEAESLQDALMALADKVEAARKLSRQVGIDYAYKIAPMPVRISRSFYTKSKYVREMGEGARYADVGDWEAAARVWEEGLNFADQKDSGRLSYNIAIANEVLGDWEEARRWAERAYVEYGNKDARDYINQLDRRVWREELAMKQLE